MDKVHTGSAQEFIKDMTAGITLVDAQSEHHQSAVMWSRKEQKKSASGSQPTISEVLATTREYESHSKEAKQLNRAVAEFNSHFYC